MERIEQKYQNYWEAFRLASGITQEHNEIAWEYVIEMARKQNMLPVLYDGLWRHQKENLLPDTRREQIKARTCYDALLEFNRHMDLERVLTQAEKQNIKLVCFKGIVVAAQYPDWKMRLSKDADIYVYQRDHEKAAALLESLGYQKLLHKSKLLVPVYRHPGREHVIELHFSLWEDYEGEQIDLLESMGLIAEDSIVRTKACGIKVWTMEPTNHLIFQMFHIIKHFIVQGIGARYLLDIALFVNHYREEIDRERFWSCMEQLHYTDFCCHFFRICAEQLAMDDRIIKGCKVSESKKKEAALLTDLMEYGNKKELDYKVITIMSPYLEGKQRQSGNRFTRRLQLLFPKADALQEEFFYAKKYRLLLPAAWVHKWCRFVGNRIKGRSKSVKSKFSEADSRIMLMKEMDLLG